jgi:putative endonuclease
MMKSFFLYILRSQIKETYYTGFSQIPEQRHYYHNCDSKGYTKRYRPWELAYAKRFASKQEAVEAERKVKSWKSKKMVRLLIKGKIDIEDYLP